MRRPFLTKKAFTDLQDIRRYTLRVYGADQAERYLAGLREKLNLLAAIPRIAPRISSELTVRMGLYEKHRILYREIEQGIEVGRVLHQAQDFSRELEAYARRIRQIRRLQPGQGGPARKE
jgi:toxin ParE1/3/4